VIDGKKVLTGRVDSARSGIFESVRDELWMRRIRESGGRYAVIRGVLESEVRVMLMKGGLSLQRIHRVVQLHVDLGNISSSSVVHLLLLLELLSEDAVKSLRMRIVGTRERSACRIGRNNERGVMRLFEHSGAAHTGRTVERQ
jgi:hypothetical protein